MAMRGIPLTLGDGKQYVVAPLSLGALEDYGEQIKSFNPGEIFEPGTIALIIDISFASLKRNYPNITRDEVRDLVDIDTAPRIFEACMAVSGALPKDAPSGEAKAPAKARSPRRR